MSQPIGFEEIGKDHIVCKLKKFIYGLKQLSSQWYLKFDEVFTANGFKENIIDQCICIVTPPFPIRPEWRIQTESRRETIYWDSLTCFFSELNLNLWLYKQFL